MYCSFCAGVLDANQAVCSRCGRPTGAVPVPAAATPTSERPSSVRLAVILLAVCIGISLLSTMQVIAMYPRASNASYLTRTFSFTILWIVLAVFLWQRQSWARIALLLLIAWGIGNIALSLIRFGSNIRIWALAIPLALDAIRLFAAYLTFKPESNAWFKN